MTWGQRLNGGHLPGRHRGPGRQGGGGSKQEEEPGVCTAAHSVSCPQLPPCPPPGVQPLRLQLPPQLLRVCMCARACAVFTPCGRHTALSQTRRLEQHSPRSGGCKSGVERPKSLVQRLWGRPLLPLAAAGGHSHPLTYDGLTCSAVSPSMRPLRGPLPLGLEPTE